MRKYFAGLWALWWLLGAISAVAQTGPGFTAANPGTPISVTTGGVSGTLPPGSSVMATNVGAQIAYCQPGAAATTSSQPITPGTSFQFQIVPGTTQLTCITSTGTTTVNLIGGSGQGVVGNVGLPASQTGGGVTVANLVCDGTTDNAALLQSYLNTAGAAVVAGTGSGSTVYFPPAAGACMLGSDVTVPNGVTLFAYPDSVTLKAKVGNVSSPLLLNFNANSGGNLVYGLTFDGGGYGTSAFASTNNVNQAFNSQYVVFDHVAMQNTAGAGIVFSTQTSFSGVRDSSFTNVGISQSTFTGTIAATTLTVNSGQVGTILAGATVSCVGCSYQTTIVSGTGPTYTITPSQTVGPVSMTATFGKQGVAFCCGVQLDTPGVNTSSISGTTLTTGNAQTSAIIGQNVYGTGVSPDTTILSGSGTSWTVSVSQTVAGTALQAANNKGNFTTTSSFSGTGLDAISYTQEHDFTARLNNVTNAGISSAAGIYDHYNDTTVVVGNIIYNVNGNGIDLAGTSNASVVGNSVKFSGGAGIAYAWASHATIVGNISIDNYQTKNTTTNPAQAALFLSGTASPVTYVTICNNDFSDLQTTPTQTYGIEMQSASTSSNIYICPSNVIFGNATGQLSTPLSFTQSTTTAYAATTNNIALPPNTNLVRFITIGQGGCGGGGVAVAAGASVSGGGGGGGSAPKDTGWIQASLLSSTGTVTIGTQCTSAAAGASGSVGGNAQIAWTGMDTQISYGGGGGALGISASVSGGGGGAGAIAVGGSTTTASAGGAGGGGGAAGGAGSNGSNNSNGASGGGGGTNTAAAGGAGGIPFNAFGSSGGGAGGGCASGVAEAGGNSFSPGSANTLAGGAATGAQPSSPTNTSLGYAGQGGAGGGGKSGTNAVGGAGSLLPLPGGGGGGGGSTCGTTSTGGAGGVGGKAEVVMMTM